VRGVQVVEKQAARHNIEPSVEGLGHRVVPPEVDVDAEAVRAVPGVSQRGLADIAGMKVQLDPCAHGATGQRQRDIPGPCREVEHTQPTTNPLRNLPDSQPEDPVTPGERIEPRQPAERQGVLGRIKFRVVHEFWGQYTPHWKQMVRISSGRVSLPKKNLSGKKLPQPRE